MKDLTADEAMDLGLIRGPWLGGLQRSSGGKLTPVVARISMVCQVNRADEPLLALLLESAGDFRPTSKVRAEPPSATHQTRAAALCAAITLLHEAMAPPKEALVEMAQTMLQLTDAFIAEMASPSEQ